MTTPTRTHTATPDHPSIMDTMNRATDIAVAAMNSADPDKVERIRKSTKCVEEYAHFRYMGISRELTLTHLAKVYDTTTTYLNKICKENAS